jgi:transposase
VAKRKNDVTDQQITEAYLRLGSGRAVQNELGVSLPTIYAALDAAGIERSGHGPPRSNNATDAEIIASYGRHHAISRVKAELGVTEGTILSVLKSAGIERDGTKRLRAVSDADEAGVLARYADGASAAQIAAQRGCGTEAILNVLRRNGVEIRSSRKEMSDEEIKRSAELYRSGKPHKQVAAELGRSEQTVIRHLRDRYPEICRPKGGKGEMAPGWNGGRHISHGYVNVFAAEDDLLAQAMKDKRGYVLEHRLIMARKLGRPLLRSETVHHIDGDQLNNDPDNLQLRQGKHGKHIVMRCRCCGSEDVEAIEIADPS